MRGSGGDHYTARRHTVILKRLEDCPRLPKPVAGTALEGQRLLVSGAPGSVEVVEAEVAGPIRQRRGGLHVHLSRRLAAALCVRDEGPVRDLRRRRVDRARHLWMRLNS